MFPVAASASMRGVLRSQSFQRIFSLYLHMSTYARTLTTFDGIGVDCEPQGQHFVLDNVASCESLILHVPFATHVREVVVRDRPIARSSGVDQALRGWMVGPIPRRQLGQRASATGAGEPRPSQGISSPLLDTEGGLSPDFVWTASRVASAWQVPSVPP